MITQPAKPLSAVEIDARRMAQVELIGREDIEVRLRKAWPTISHELIAKVAHWAVYGSRVK